MFIYNHAYYTNMEEQAQIILSGHDEEKLTETINMVGNFSKNIGLEIKDNFTGYKTKATLWGTRRNVGEKIFDINGTRDQLLTLLELKIPDGVYLELLTVKQKL